MSLQANFVDDIDLKQAVEEVNDNNNVVSKAITSREVKHDQHAQELKRQEEPKRARKETWMETLEYLNHAKNEREVKPNIMDGNKMETWMEVIDSLQQCPAQGASGQVKQAMKEVKEDNTEEEHGKELTQKQLDEAWMAEASLVKREQLKQQREKQKKQPEQSKFRKG